MKFTNVTFSTNYKEKLTQALQVAVRNPQSFELNISYNFITREIVETFVKNSGIRKLNITGHNLQSAEDTALLFQSPSLEELKINGPGFYYHESDTDLVELTDETAKGIAKGLLITKALKTLIIGDDFAEDVINIISNEQLSIIENAVERNSSLQKFDVINPVELVYKKILPLDMLEENNTQQQPDVTNYYFCLNGISGERETSFAVKDFNLKASPEFKRIISYLEYNKAIANINCNRPFNFFSNKEKPLFKTDVDFIEPDKQEQLFKKKRLV